jgi:V/A-type H+/Na+-transporting ATPase subunit E
MTEGANRIISRVVKDAESKSEAIISEAAEKAAQLDKEAKENASRQAGKIIEQARKEALARKRRILGIAELESRKEVLAAKQELISEAFTRTLNELLEADDQAYLELIRKMLMENVVSGQETVAVSADDQKRIPDTFWKDINDQLKKIGKEGKLALASESRDIRGGFVLLAEGLEINCSFEALLEMVRDEMEPEVAAVLFK